MDSTKNGSSRNGKFRVVSLPWLGSTHISAFLELAKRMSIHNFHVFICSTPIHFPSMRKYNLAQKYDESIKLVDLNMPSSAEFPPHYHTTNGLPPHHKNKLMFTYEECHPHFTKILKNLKPHLVVYDYNQWWAVDAASLFNIPCVQFLIGPVTPCVVFLYKAMKQAAEQSPIPRFNVDEYETTNTKDDGDIVNSPPEENQVLPVGPLFPESFLDAKSDDNDEHIEIFRWLDQKKKEFPEGSNTRIEQVLPKGFLQRIGDKSMFITKWAPQARILNHLSTWGFLCHCRWVSVLESIYYGVPIIGLPMQYDHPGNAKLIEKHGIGIIVGRNEDGSL
uniref:cyanidin-3-O-glucoside 2-O-glucuronosyltransferase-like n=1 Tax=Erigeron canadensis TaxID=72917 RepID=UPI001CB9A594|nr:cyanidin-3-O-glucoside 2-O-glucuronosyltransferase-like [Erigeron canadensis]